MFFGLYMKCACLWVIVSHFEWYNLRNSLKSRQQEVNPLLEMCCVGDVTQWSDVY